MTENGKGSLALDVDVTAPEVTRLCLELTNQYFTDLLLNLRMHRFGTI